MPSICLWDHNCDTVCVVSSVTFSAVKVTLNVADERSPTLISNVAICRWKSSIFSRFVFFVSLPAMQFAHFSDILMTIDTDTCSSQITVCGH